MKRRIALIALIVFTALVAGRPAAAAESAPGAAGNFSFGIGPVGNIFVIDGSPELSPGVGGYLFFDYRWSPQFSTQFSVIVTTEDGKGISEGNDGIVWLGMPTFDLKFYILSEPSRWDPYGLIGVGGFAVTNGSKDDGTFAIGIGSDLGIGTDFYLTEKLSLGLTAMFRAIALIDSPSGKNQTKAIFPVSLMGNIAYHF
jgi:outer membrane protein W